MLKDLNGVQVTEKIRLYNCDNMEFMKQIPDNYYDLSICDPPYGIGQPKQSNLKGYKGRKSLEERLEKNRLNTGAGKLKNRLLNNSNCNWDDSIPSDEYFVELKRISKNQIIWGGNYFHLPPSRCIICWDKCQPWENFSQIELAWTSFDMPAQIFKFDNRTGDKIHPTQKPVSLYKYLLDKYAKQGDKIFDSHLGSMSIAIACHDYGFELDGCELDPEYFEKGLKRVKNHISQLRLF
jgi:site-specific DNA-methyltransferase (adenine-specific)